MEKDKIFELMNKEELIKIPEAPLRAIKLYRNSTSKGIISYSWEIKIDNTSVEEIKKLDEEMNEKFGVVINTGEVE